MYIDTHTHYNLKCFNRDREELLARMHGNGIRYLINPAIDFESNYQNQEKLGMYDWIYFGVGIHPNKIGIDDSADDRWNRCLQKLIGGSRIVAVGETGLDYHRFTYDEAGCPDTDSRCRKERQKQWFHRQIELALRAELPLILHIREAHEDAVAILEQYAFPADRAGVVHCFNGDTAMAMYYISKGFCIGLGGSITREDEQLREAVASIPLRSIMLETDAPYVTPEGVEESRNTSENLPLIAKEISRLKQISLEEVIEATNENVRRVFGVG